MPSDFPLDLAQKCVKCGLCLPQCPTYQLHQTESEGPRGRLAIMEAVATKQIPLTELAKSHIDRCLGCGRCEAICPAKVPYLEIRDHHHQQHKNRWEQFKLGLLDTALIRRILFAGLRLLRQLLPTQLHPRALHAVSARRLQRPSRGATLPNGTVQLFTGCMGAELGADTLRASFDLLRHIHADLQLTTSAQCCGALAQHEGAAGRAQAHHLKLRSLKSHKIIALDSGCIGSLRQKNLNVDEACRHLLEHWPEDWAPQPRPEQVALHLPCTHRNQCGDESAVVELMGKIPQLEIHHIKGLGCCGAGGMHGVHNPNHAQDFTQALLAEVPDHIRVLLSTNIGCRSQIKMLRPDLRVLHPLELLMEQQPQL